MRSLSRAGYRTIVAHGAGRGGHARHSRFASGRWCHPPINGTGREMAEALVRYLEANPDVRVVIPLGDGETRTLALHEHLLPKGVRPLTPSSETTRTCLDKLAMCDIASQLGIPQAPYARADTRSDLFRAAKAVGYPCIVKAANPLRSVMSEKAVICHSPPELEQRFSQWPSQTESLLVQRFVAGPRYNIQVLAQDGAIVARLITKTIRTDRPNYTGYTTESVTVAATPELDEYTRNLIHRTSYSGYGCLQFLINELDGSMSFLELNPRLGAAFAVSSICGVDFPRLGVDLALGRAVQQTPDLRYPPGKRIVWTGGDLEGILKARDAGQITFGNALKWLWHAAVGFTRADIHTTWSWSDPWPTARQYAMILAAVALRAVRGSRSWAAPPDAARPPLASPAD
ncbi:MAG TPA: ATP-grasp domain-containing protein [Gemmatimonadales bacterium]|nr:ATP-grasp domain-containing protein [Gemmatimonadales bacterium]